MGLNDAGDPSFLSDVRKVFAPRVSGVREIYEPGPGQGAGLPGGRAAHLGRRGRERGRRGGRAGLEEEHDRCPGVKGDNLPTQ